MSQTEVQLIKNNAVVEADIANDAVTRDKINVVSTSSAPGIEIKGDDGSQEGYLQLNCRVNSHGVKIQSPPHSASQSYKIILPDNQIAADKILKVKSITGSGSTATGQLEFADDSGGKFASYAIICDQKGTNTAGGSSSTGTFNVRDLNTELSDADSIVSISSNQFTLQAGTYLIKASAPSYKGNRHQIIIHNATDVATVAIGTSEFSYHENLGTTTRSFAMCRVTIGAAKAFEIRHRHGRAQATNGLGLETNYDTLASVYTIVEIFKEA